MPKKNVISYVLRAPKRLQVMEALTKEPKISAQLEKDTRMYKSHVSRTLKELKEEDLVECTNPDDKSYKFYKLTSKGKATYLKAKKLKEY